jgi:hypothetical protein
VKRAKMKLLSELLVNKWFISFIVGWVVLFLLIDWKELHVNIWGGVTACLLQLVHDTEQDWINNYHIYYPGIWLLKSSFFFTFGIVFTMGIIIFQYLPRNKVLKITYILVFSFGFLFFEYLMVIYGTLKYIHYNYWISITDDILVMSTLAWTKSFVLYIYNSKERRI